jgi:hypothetical protein
VPREPKEENLRLRSLLDEAAMSNKGLARRVVDLAAIQGLAGVRCDHTSVLECVRYFVRGGFSLSGSGSLSLTVFSRYLMPCCPVYPAVPRNRTFRAVPGLMLRVPVFPASCAVAGACCLILRGSYGEPFPSVIKYSRR